METELAEQVQLVWEPLVSPEAYAALAAVALLSLLLAARGGVGLGWRKRLGLVALRGLGLLLLLLVVAGPAQQTTRGRSRKEPFVVLIDSSRSMRVEEGGLSRAARVGRWLKDRAPELAELGREVDVRTVLVDSELRGLSGAAPGEVAMAAGGGPGSGEPTPADGASTDLGAGLQGLRSYLEGTKPSGVLLISDGADRSALGRAWKRDGADGVAALLDGLAFPVSTWALGDEAGPPDLAIRDAAAPPFGFVRRPVTVEVELSSRGLAAGSWPLTLRGKEGIEAVRDVRIDADGDASVSFELKPDRIGYHTWSLELPVPAGDGVPSNNRVDFTVKVLRDRTRVLQVTSRPSWDVKFLRRLLKTDPNVDLVSFFILRHRRGGGTLPGEELSLIAFPHRELFTTDLQGFDLVVMQNFWFGSFAPFPDEEYLDSIASYVRDGGALLLVGGDQIGDAGYGSSPLASVLPTTTPNQPPRADTFQAVPTEAGRRHPITRLDRDAARSDERWAKLPPLQGWNPLGELEAGAVPLLKAGEDGPVIVAARDVGRGRALMVGTDTTWRWALGGEDGSGRDHATLWRNAVRWLVKDAEQRQVEVVTDQENYRLGATIRAQVRVLGADYAPRADAAVRLTMSRVGGEELRTVDGVTDGSGHLEVQLPAIGEGTWVLQADVPSIGDPYGEAEARVSVSDRDGELEDPRANPALLAALAKATGGRAFGGSDPDPQQAERSEADALLAVERRVEPRWNHPLLLLGVLLPLGLEWVLRRRMGLR